MHTAGSPAVARQDSDDSSLQCFQCPSTSPSSSPDRSECNNATTLHPPGHYSQPRAASPSTGSLTTGALRRRTSTPSQGGTDRRRLAIVEMPDTRASLVQDRYTRPAIRPSVSGGGSPNNLRSCLEPHLVGLALVAPPDASPQRYSESTPTRAAPVPKLQPSIPVSHPPPSNHARSSSDVLDAFSRGAGHAPRKSSHDVVVATANFPRSTSVPQEPTNPPDSLRLPVFQIPQSKSPSPRPSEISDSGCSAHRARQRKDALVPGVSPIGEVKDFFTPVRTPSIGESKHISERVATPIVINFFPQSPSPVFSSPHSSMQDFMSPRTNPSTPMTPSTALTSPTTIPSPYLQYQPGLHATAGPLPPPPQIVFNFDSKVPPPPRPPRHSPIRRKDDIEAVKQALQLPPHVTAALSTKPLPVSAHRGDSSPCSPRMAITDPPSATPPADSPPSSRESLSSDFRPHHVREGAFPPSRICTLDSDTLSTPHEEIATSLPRFDSMDDLVASIGLAIDDMGIMSSCDVPPPTVVEPPRGYEGQHGGKGLDIRRADNPRPGSNHGHTPERPHTCPDVNSAEEAVPPVPAKNDLPYLDTKSLKNALNIKRFSSLPRTPSLMSLNRPSVGSKRSSGTPPSLIARSMSHPRPLMRKMKSTHPPAMYFADVIVKRTALERSIGYTRKINELYNCDCGLGDWIAETRYKALHPQTSGKRSNINASSGPRAPSTSSPSIAPRHISQSSTDSGVTFPRRADAYSATDLAPRAAGDSSLPNSPPPLPYPGLAAASRPSRASTMIATSSSSSSRSAVSPSVVKSPGNFFASLGRRASLRKEKPLTPPSPVKRLSKSPPKIGNEQLGSRAANPLPVAPSVPGGPRAPPNRMQRSQTIVVTSQNSMNETSPQRSSTVSRGPSLSDSQGSPQRHTSLVSGVEFNRQVDKLAALLPRADRNVLAIYLRRAGQDILAIGQYLEDEKNGTLRYE